LGYEEGIAKKALACNPSVETAVDWIEAHRDELEVKPEHVKEPLKTPNSDGASKPLVLPVKEEGMH
jgi:hypothetical protein